ncbi:MAG: hypothetical protein PVJ33_12125 [Lysobacterales bacterium]
MCSKRQRPALRRARGFSVVETMVAMALSLLTTAAMLGLVSGSLSGTSSIVQQTRLSDDLRVAMMMMSRDIRRSNYTADSILCYANPDCATDGSLQAAGDVAISEGGDCIVFMLDRDSDGDATENGSGGFRRSVSGGVGELQVWTGSGVADCDSTDSKWTAVTDSLRLDVTSLTFEDSLSYQEVIFEDADGSQTFQRVRKINVALAGRLQSDHSVVREIHDVVKLRNNLYL